MDAGALRRLDDVLGRGEDLFLAVSHGLIAVLVIAAVFFRYVMSDPLTWTEEFIVIVFTWMLFIGLASGFRHRMHIRIDVLLMLLGHPGRKAVGALATATVLATLAALAWVGTEQALMMATTQTPMLRISAAWAVSAVPAGAALSCLHVVRRVVCEGPQQALWPEDLVGAAEGEV